MATARPVGPSRRRMITLRDGTRVTLRPIAPQDKPLLAASFAPPLLDTRAFSPNAKVAARHIRMPAADRCAVGFDRNFRMQDSP